jgi:hypothetical protein
MLSIDVIKIVSGSNFGSSGNIKKVSRRQIAFKSLSLFSVPQSRLLIINTCCVSRGRIHGKISTFSHNLSLRLANQSQIKSTHSRIFFLSTLPEHQTTKTRSNKLTEKLFLSGFLFVVADKLTGNLESKLIFETNTMKTKTANVCGRNDVNCTNVICIGRLKTHVHHPSISVITSLYSFPNCSLSLQLSLPHSPQLQDGDSCK